MESRGRWAVTEGAQGLGQKGQGGILGGGGPTRAASAPGRAWGP